MAHVLWARAERMGRDFDLRKQKGKKNPRVYMVVCVCVLPFLFGERRRGWTSINGYDKSSIEWSQPRSILVNSMDFQQCCNHAAPQPRTPTPTHFRVGMLARAAVRPLAIAAVPASEMIRGCWVGSSTLKPLGKWRPWPRPVHPLSSLNLVLPPMLRTKPHRQASSRGLVGRRAPCGSRRHIQLRHSFDRVVLHIR